MAEQESDIGRLSFKVHTLTITLSVDCSSAQVAPADNLLLNKLRGKCPAEEMFLFSLFAFCCVAWILKD